MYFMDTDDSGHWYVIPESKRKEWEEWANLPEDDPAGWDEPDYAHSVGGSPAQVTFQRPVIFGKAIEGK